MVAVAVAVVVVTQMRLPFRRREHTIDYAGSATLAAGIAALLLVAVWGGSSYGWASGEIVGLAAGGTALLTVFVLIERPSAEPVLPLRLFRNSIFTVANVAALLIGTTLLGATIYVPLFVQGVIGRSAINSGLVVMPLSLGWVGAGVLVGWLVSRTGRYRISPIVGTAIVLAGFLLLTQLDAHSLSLVTTRDMVMIGIGMGLSFQTDVIALQNAVDRSELGVATAANQFFRSAGGTFAVAGFGALLSRRLARELPRHIGSRRPEGR